MKREDSKTRLERYKDDFATDYNAIEEQRDKANEELRFSTVPGAQWEGYLAESYENRAKLELDQVSDYIQRTYGQWLQDRVSVKFSPDDDITSEDDADLLMGLYRRDYRRGGGQMAGDQAVLEAMSCGIGAVHIGTDYEDTEDEFSDDQSVTFRCVPNAYAMVAFDSAAKALDKSDAKRCTAIYEYSHDAFERAYPDADPVSAGLVNDRREFNWTTQQSVFVGVRYEVHEKRDTVLVFGNPLTGEQQRFYGSDGDDVREEAESMGFELLLSKKVTRRHVTKVVFSGAEILEPERKIAGKCIPIVPVYGYRQYVDGQEFFHGLVRKRMDAQRLFNMEVSLLAENAASNYKRIPIFDPRQIKNLEHIWSSDLSKKNYLVAHPIVGPDGQVLHSGPSGYLEPPTLNEGTRAIVELTGSFMGAGTGGAPQDTIDPDASGKAINAVLKRVDLNTSGMRENFAVAFRRIGQVYRSIAADIYAKPRSIKVLGQDGQERRVQLMQVTVDPQTGEPTYGNDLSRGRYEVIATTGPAYETQKEATVETLKDIWRSLDANDPYRNIVMAMMVQNLDGPGIEDLRRLSRRNLLAQGISEPEGDEEQQFVAQLRAQQANQTQDAQQALIAATTQQQLAEAENLRASSVQKLADAEYKRAQAVEKVDSMKTRRIEMMLDTLGKRAEVRTDRMGML